MTLFSSFSFLMNRHFGLRLINVFGAKLRTHIHLLTAYNILRTAFLPAHMSPFGFVLVVISGILWILFHFQENIQL